MRHIQQPPRSHLCGQACVAMIADLDLEAAVGLIGKTGKTRTSDLRRALHHCGWQLLAPLLLARHHAIPPNPQQPILVRILAGTPVASRHYVVFYERDVYDPEFTEPIPRHQYIKGLSLPLFGEPPRRIGGWAYVIESKGY